MRSLTVGQPVDAPDTKAGPLGLSFTFLIALAARRQQVWGRSPSAVHGDDPGCDQPLSHSPNPPNTGLHCPLVLSYFQVVFCNLYLPFKKQSQSNDAVISSLILVTGRLRQIAFIYVTLSSRKKWPTQYLFAMIGGSAKISPFSVHFCKYSYPEK